MRMPAWAAAWWQRRRASATRREAVRLLSIARTYRLVARRAGARRTTVQLVGGSRDGLPYWLPVVYNSPDGLPDAIATLNRGEPELYWREGASLRYRYRRSPRAGAPR